jgi:putative transposase
MSKRKRRSPEQIIAVLREAEALLNAGQPLAAVIQHLGVSEATYYRRRNQLELHRRPLRGFLS